MFDIDKILSSKAKITILRILYHQREPIPLRHISSLSNMHVYSIQNGLIQLLRDNIVKKNKKGHYTLYFLNQENKNYDFITKMFSFEVINRLSNNAKLYNKKAQDVLQFTNSAIKLFRKIEGK